MSLDVYLEDVLPTEVYWANITHNLGRMAKAAGIYQHLWRPDELGISEAGDLVKPLRKGLEKMKKNPARFKKYDAENKWGTYEQFVPWVEKYLAACEQFPKAQVRVSR
jgi:hypothetical protein